jgi:hypothetical protein
MRWYEGGGESVQEVGARPGHSGADESWPPKILKEDVCLDTISLPPEDDLRLYIWLDANVTFYTTYEEQAQAAQKAEQVVPEPLVQ